MRQAETDHRGHAIIEQVIADLKSGHRLNSLQVCRHWRLAGDSRDGVQPHPRRWDDRVVFHAKATTATIRRQLIAVLGRLASSARRLVILLPKDWPWQDSWEGLFNAACGPPTPATT